MVWLELVDQTGTAAPSCEQVSKVVRHYWWPKEVITVVTSSICRGKTGQLLAWIPSLACLVTPASEKESFTLCPVCDDRFIAMASRMMGPGSICGSLSGAISVVCLILFDLFRPWVLNGSIYMSDPDDLISWDLFLEFVAPERSNFALSAYSFPSGRPNSLLTLGDSSKVSGDLIRFIKISTGHSYENGFGFCPLSQAVCKFSVMHTWHWDRRATAAGGHPLGFNSTKSSVNRSRHEVELRWTKDWSQWLHFWWWSKG